MLTYLKDFDISEEEIKELMDTYDIEILRNLDFSKSNVKQIIKYLKEFGVTNILNCLMKRIDLFFLPVNLVKQNFTKLDKNMLLYVINNNIDDLIYYNI